MPGFGGDGREDRTGEDRPDGVEFSCGTGVIFVVDVVDEEDAGGVFADNSPGAVAQPDQSRVFAFFLGAEFAPFGVVDVSPFDFVPRSPPPSYTVRDDVRKDKPPTIIGSDEVGDLLGGVLGCFVPDLDEEVRSVGVVADLEGEPGDGEGGGFGRAAKGFDDNTFAFSFGGVDGGEPFFEGVLWKVAVEKEPVELFESFNTGILSGEFNSAPEFEVVDFVGGE